MGGEGAADSWSVSETARSSWRDVLKCKRYHSYLLMSEEAGSPGWAAWPAHPDPPDPTPAWTSFPICPLLPLLQGSSARPALSSLGPFCGISARCTHASLKPRSFALGHTAGAAAHCWAAPGSHGRFPSAGPIASARQTRTN